MVDLWGLTDKGMVRAQNQDACAFQQKDGYAWAVVCDGMGGAAAGDHRQRRHRVGAARAALRVMAFRPEVVRACRDRIGFRASHPDQNEGCRERNDARFAKRRGQGDL